MAIIKPFKGIRPPQALIEQVASRPYDVLNSEEARKEAEGNEKSLYHIIKPEIDFRWVLMSTMKLFIKKQQRILPSSKKTDGWYKTKKNSIMYMHKL